MPTQIPADALLPATESEEFKKQVGQLLFYGKRYWRPLHARQDNWAGMYHLLDIVQQSKPLGYRRFISNEPQTAIDTAVSILTRNDSFWRIDLSQEELENKEARMLIGKVERTLQGIVFDIDEMFTERGEPPLWKRVAYMALLRGWIWGKFHVTTEALEYRASPLTAEIYDSRTVLPHFDAYGLNYALIESLDTLGALRALYPEELEGIRDTDPNTPATKVEFWSNKRGEMEGVSGTLATIHSGATPPAAYQPYPESATLGADARWLIPPYRHGYPPDALPIVGVPVNGSGVKVKPPLNTALSQALDSRWDLFGVQTRDWQGPNTWVAESGRSILAAVEDHMPQFNELVSTIFQHFSNEAYPTWLFKNPAGQVPNFEPGIGAKIPMLPEETVERIGSQAISQDAFRLMSILREEQQKGTLSDVLRATLPSQGGSDFASGIALQQVLNSALNALEPQHDGMERFGTRAATSMLRQIQLARGSLKKFEVSTPDRLNSYVRIEFNPRTDLEQARKYRARPIFRPALPDDLHIRIQSARVALDPQRPVLSLLTVLERIIQTEDPTGEIDRMWEDMANRDPVIMLEQIAQAFDRLEEPELAERMREARFRQKFIEDLQFRQQTGNVPGSEGGQSPGQGPETGVPDSTQRTSSPAEQEQAALARDGAELLGTIGGGGRP